MNHGLGAEQSDLILNASKPRDAERMEAVTRSN